MTDKVKIYPLDIKTRDIIDKTFNELHEQERLK